MNAYKIKVLETEEEARDVVEFLFSAEAFDDRNFTPGDIEMMSCNPFKSLTKRNFRYWYARNETGAVIAANGVRENEHKTGGYWADYVAVHRDYRKHGLAGQMVDLMLDHIRGLSARYILAQCGDSELYHAIWLLLESKGFQCIGSFPEYFFKGEGVKLFLYQF